MSEGEEDSDRGLNIKQILLEGPVRVAITDFCELHTLDKYWDVVWDTGFLANPKRVSIVHGMIFSISSGRKEIQKLDSTQRKEIYSRHFATLEQYCGELAIPIIFQNESLRTEIKVQEKQTLEASVPLPKDID